MASASRLASWEAVLTMWNASRWADFGPMPGRRFSSSTRSWIGPSYTRPAYPSSTTSAPNCALRSSTRSEDRSSTLAAPTSRPGGNTSSSCSPSNEPTVATWALANSTILRRAFSASSTSGHERLSISASTALALGAWTLAPATCGGSALGPRDGWSPLGLASVTGGVPSAPPRAVCPGSDGAETAPEGTPLVPEGEGGAPAASDFGEVASEGTPLVAEGGAEPPSGK